MTGLKFKKKNYVHTVVIRKLSSSRKWATMLRKANRTTLPKNK